MSIRLNKVTKEFNIGLQTAVEFLQKKGFNDIEANPNYKITEEQYAALQKAFSSDKGLRNEATQLIQQHFGQAKERKEAPKPKPVEEVQIETPKVVGPKILGRIDLGEKRTEAPKAEKAPAAQPKPKEQPVKVEKKAEPKPPLHQHPLRRKSLQHLRPLLRKNLLPLHPLRRKSRLLLPLRRKSQQPQLLLLRKPRQPQHPLLRKNLLRLHQHQQRKRRRKYSASNQLLRWLQV